MLINRPSPFPFSTTFVSPVTIATPAAAAASAIDAAIRRRTSVGKSLFENESRAQEQWPRAAHREIVHRTVHRQRSNVAARKKSGFTTNESVVNANRVPPISSTA